MKLVATTKCEPASIIIHTREWESFQVCGHLRDYPKVKSLPKFVDERGFENAQRIIEKSFMPVP